MSQAFEQMLTVDSRASISEIHAWDVSGQVYKLSFSEGTTIRNMKNIIEFNFAVITKFMFILHPTILIIKTNATITVHLSEYGTIIDGQLYLDHILRNVSSAEEALTAVADFVLLIAQTLNATYLAIADEDDESIILPTTGIRLPSLLGIGKGHFFSQQEKELREHGAAIVEPELTDFRIVWVAAISEILQGAKLDRSVQTVFQNCLEDAGIN